MKKANFVGKKLYNATGHLIGIIEDIDDFSEEYPEYDGTQECFVVNDEASDLGRIFPTARLQPYRTDRITIGTSQAERWHKAFIECRVSDHNAMLLTESPEFD